MFWMGDDEPDTRALILVKKIRELRKKGLLSLTDGSALKIYEFELSEIRSTCSHDWGRPILMYMRHRRYCRRCDQEDLQYDHQG